MPAHALDRKITKVTINLYSSDLEYLKEQEGEWSVRAREIIHNHVVMLKNIKGK